MPEVVITGAKPLAAERASIGGFGDAPLLETPASISTIGRKQIEDFGIHNSTDAMKLDASVSDSYNAVGYAELLDRGGYAENFSIRGFALDNTSSYRKDGIAIPGDTQIPLENKERIEVLKGLAGLQAGVAAPGGIINYVTKRPTVNDLRSVTLEVRERGTVYGAVDLGGRFDRQALRLPHQRRRRKAALLRQGRRRRAQVRLRRVRLADHAGRAAAARHRLPAQVAADRAGLPADPQRQPADRDLADHAAQRPAVGKAGRHEEHQRRPAFRIPHQQRLAGQHRHEQALVQARRLHRLPLRLQQRGRRLLSGLLLERRLRRL